MQIYTAKTLEELLQNAAEEKGVTIDELEYTVVEEKKGLLGIGNSVSAKVFSSEDVKEFIFEKLLEGDYEGYIYSRTMIGIYKNLANATLYKIYQDQAKFEQLEEMKPMLEQFAQTGVGKRWIQSLDITLDNTTEEPVEKEVVENKKSNSEENLSETMVLEKLTDSDIKKLDQKPSENLSETMVLEKLTDADLEEKDKK